jgi:hypothetical protein
MKQPCEGILSPLAVAPSAGPDLMQPSSESTVETGFNVRMASNWTWGHFQVTWHGAHLLHVSLETF